MNYLLAGCLMAFLSVSSSLAQSDTVPKVDSIPKSLRVHFGTLGTPVSQPATHRLLLPTNLGPAIWVNSYAIAAQPLLWPGLPSNMVRIQDWPTFDCSSIIQPMGPRDGLWQLMDDGGLIRSVGSNLEYEAPAIILR